MNVKRATRPRSCTCAAICLNGRMARVYIDELSHHAGTEFTLKGCLAGKRSSGKIHFLQVRDGTGVCQCVASLADLGADHFAAADHMGQESSLEVRSEEDTSELQSL